MAIASSDELHLLETKCSRLLADNLSIHNAVETWTIADKYSDHELRHKSFSLVRDVFEKLPPSQIDGMDHRLLKDVMESDAVFAEEQFLFECLLSWFKKDEDNRGQHMARLLKLIRLPLIQAQNLDNDTMRMFYGKFDCAELLNAESRRRIACPTPNAGTRRRLSVCCLFKQFAGEADAQRSVIKVERYNSALNEFGEVGRIELGQRKNFEAIQTGDKVYILGGRLEGLAQKSVSVFDVNSGEERVLPEMSTSRSRFSSILVGNFIYVFGGWKCHSDYSFSCFIDYILLCFWHFLFFISGVLSISDRFASIAVKLRSCERLNLETETWETLKPTSVARTGAAVAVLDKYIYVAGGQNSRSRTLKTVELFDPTNNEWIPLSPMNDVRSEFALLSSNGHLYAMGGEHSPSMEKCDPWKNRWKKIDSSVSCKNITSVVQDNDSIYVVRKNGEFSEMRTDQNGGCSFIPCSKSKFETKHIGRQFLYRN